MLFTFLFFFLASAGIAEILATFLIFAGLALAIFGPSKKKDAKIGCKGIGWIVFGISVFTIAAITTFATALTSLAIKIALAIFIGLIAGGIIMFLSRKKVRNWPVWVKIILFVVLTIL